MGPHAGSAQTVGVGVAGVVDQVVRKDRFLRAHPSVQIMSPRQAGGFDWTATWDEANGSTTIRRSELRNILDVLEERFGVPD